MKYTVIHRTDKKNEPNKHLVLDIIVGDANYEVPSGYTKTIMEMETALLPVKQVYDKLGVEYINETQKEEEQIIPIIEIDYSKE